MYVLHVKKKTYLSLLAQLRGGCICFNIYDDDVRESSSASDTSMLWWEDVVGGVQVVIELQAPCIHAITFTTVGETSSLDWWKDSRRTGPKLYAIMGFITYRWATLITDNPYMCTLIQLEPTVVCISLLQARLHIETLICTQYYLHTY